jgi:predicted nuclease of predicted toxin-antitoxin system
MKFLVDSALSPWMAAELRRAGHDTVHARELGLAAAPDREVLDRAAREGRVLLTADTDFGTLLAPTGARRPWVVVFRQTDKRPPYVPALFLANLPRLEEPLEKGGHCGLPGPPHPRAASTKNGGLPRPFAAQR